MTENANANERQRLAEINEKFQQLAFEAQQKIWREKKKHRIKVLKGEK